MGSLTSPNGSASGLRHLPCGFACTAPYALTPGRPPPGTATLLRLPTSLPTPDRSAARVSPKASPSSSASRFGHLAIPRGYGNINPLSIDYACRPRLRPRLTLGGLTCPRNPWSFGGRVSHPSFATHACILTRTTSTTGSPRCFLRRTTLPYPPTHPTTIPQELK